MDSYECMYVCSSAEKPATTAFRLSIAKTTAHPKHKICTAVLGICGRKIGQEDCEEMVKKFFVS